MFKEFREFIARGNVVDLGVGVAIGGSFSNLVNSLINNVVTPPIRMALHSAQNIATDAAGGAAEAVGFDANAAPTGLGAFGAQLSSFLLMSGVIFLAVKVSNSLKRRFAARARRRCQSRSDAVAGRFAGASGRAKRTHYRIVGADGGAHTAVGSQIGFLIFPS